MSLVHEFRRLFRYPAIELTTLICNGFLATICFYLLPADWQNWLFSEFHGKHVFVMVLVSWMISDVIATNLLGHDPQGALAALSKPHGISSFIRTKALVLAGITGLVGASVAYVMGLFRSAELSNGLALFPLYFAMPLATVSTGSILGVIFPYRLRPASWRWQNRHRRFMQLRWLALVFAPWWFLSSLATLLILPAHLLFAEGPSSTHVPHWEQSLGLSIMVWVEALLLFWLVPFICQKIARKRRSFLQDYLSSDTSG